MTASIYWGNYLVDALPPSAGPLDVVLDNDCDQAFTYAVEGDQYRVVGTGDLHDPEYDHLEVVFEISSIDDHSDHELGHLSNGQEDVLTYSGVGVNLDYCPYRIRIYPSREMEESYYNGRPTLYTAMVVFILLFTSIVFTVYDSIVEKRQKKVANTAVKSTAVVNSLFPANVRDRILGQETTAALGVNMPKSKLKSFLTAGTDSAGDSAAPIADLFPFTTVMFAGTFRHVTVSYSKQSK